MDYYRGKCLFELIELYTTPLSDERVCHVVFKARSVKGVEWLYRYKNRNPVSLIKGES